MVYEMRMYWAAPGKSDAMHARFRDHTCALFVKHGMQLVSFWVPQSKREIYGDMVYVLGYASVDARDAAWSAFRDDPAWQTAKANSEVDGILVEKLESVLLNPTDYSPIQ
ncbi:MAG: NIPSNAP family protein [Roseiflexaceae bacterium]